MRAIAPGVHNVEAPQRFFGLELGINCAQLECGIPALLFQISQFETSQLSGHFISNP